MAIRTYREAVKEALAQEMALDDRVVLIGEDVCGGQAGTAEVGSKGEAFGGVLGVTKGLWTEFGSARVIDTPDQYQRRSRFPRCFKLPASHGHMHQCS